MSWSENDFNWNVAPSNHQTKEFLSIYDTVKTNLEEKSLIFYYEKDDKELKKFISDNFIVGKFGVTKTKKVFEDADDFSTQKHQGCTTKILSYFCTEV